MASPRRTSFNVLNVGNCKKCANVLNWKCFADTPIRHSYALNWIITDAIGPWKLD